MTLKYGLFIGLCLSILFLLKVFTPFLSENNLAYTISSIIVISLPLYFCLIEVKNGYIGLLKRGISVGLIGGGVLALFILIYVSYIDIYYLDYKIVKIAENLKKQGMNDFMVEEVISSLGASKKYHLEEIGAFFGTLAKSSCIALIIAPFCKSKL